MSAHPSDRPSCRRRSLCAITVAWLALVCIAPVAPVAWAQPAKIAPAALMPEHRSGFRLTPIPSIYGTEELEQRWHEGRELELAEDFLAAAQLHETLAEDRPESAYAYWKVSRNLWRYAEQLPVDAKAERMALFERADAWASRGLAVDPDCAPCMLWKFGAMGRIATTRGVMASLGMGREMRALLERGIALQPTFADTPENSTLGNLYYASAVFHRVVPEWRWLEWFVGVRGDLDHALGMIRGAVDLAPNRIDYLVEYGAVLHCYGDRRGDAGAREEAHRVWRRALTLEAGSGTDVVDQGHARTLGADPTKSCGYSRDGWIDTSKKQMAKRG